MTPELLYSFATGSLLPLLVAIVCREKWASWVKGIVVLLSSLLVGLLAAWAGGDLVGKGVVQSVIVVWGTALATYNMFWKPTGIAPWLERITDGSHRVEATKK